MRFVLVLNAKFFWASWQKYFWCLVSIYCNYTPPEECFCPRTLFGKTGLNFLSAPPRIAVKLIQGFLTQICHPPQNWIIPVQHNQYHGCWYSGSLRRQDISTHGIAYVEWVSSCFKLGKISTTCIMSMLRNSINCKYILMLRMKILACKRLN